MLIDRNLETMAIVVIVTLCFTFGWCGNSSADTHPVAKDGGAP